MMRTPRVRVLLVPLHVTVHVIRATLGLEVVLARVDVEVHASKHVGQHGIGLDTKVIGTHVHWYVAIAQVVGRTHKAGGVGVEGARPHTHHRLQRRAHLDDRSILAHEHVAAAKYRASRQKDRNRLTKARARLKAAPLSGVPIQRDARRSTQNNRSKATACLQSPPVNAHGVAWLLA
jgi:hypothetical protein